MNNIEEILGDQSRAFLWIGCNDSCFKLFNVNIKKHFNKFPNEQIKSLLEPLVSNELIKLGYPEKNKNLLLGQVIRTNDYRVAGVIVNHITHDVDQDGNSLTFDKVIGSIYYIFMEYSLRKLFFDEVIKNKLLLQKLEHYFEYILVKNLKLYDLYQDKRVLFNFLVKLFFYTHLCNYNINLAYELSISPGDEQLIQNSIDIKAISKYKTINSLYDALYDFNILTMTPNNMKYMLTNSIGIFSYINMHANISSIISSIILSKYKHPNFASLFISTDMINGIEKIIIDTYLQRVSFDFEVLNKVLVNSLKNNMDNIKTVV